jgi:hypothetical protein
MTKIDQFLNFAGKIRSSAATQQQNKFKIWSLFVPMVNFGKNGHL